MPTRTMWTAPVPDGIAALAGHPVFQLALLGDELRAEMLKPERQRRICKEVRLTADGPVDVLIWHPIGWPERGDFVLARTRAAFYDAYRPQDFRNQFRLYDHWVCMTQERVWTTGGGERDHIALGAYVHLLERLDVYGNRLPPELTGEIPEDDEGALGGLAP